MIARLPPNALARPDDFMMPRTVNCFSPVHGAERQRGCCTREVILVGELLGQDDRVRLREKHQRIVDDRLVAAFEVVVAQAAIAGHVDAEDQQAAFAGDAACRPPLRSPARRRARSARTGRSRAPLRRSRFRRPSPAARSCRRCDRRSSRTRTARSDSRCACRRTPRRRARCPRSSAASAGRACGNTAS